MPHRSWRWGFLARLHHRAVTGEGQRVEVTMVQAASICSRKRTPTTSTEPPSTAQSPPWRPPTTRHRTASTRSGWLRRVVALAHRTDQRSALGDPPELQPYLDPAVRFSAATEIYDALSPLLRHSAQTDLVDRCVGRRLGRPGTRLRRGAQRPIVAHVNPVQEFEHPEAGTVRVIGPSNRLRRGQLPRSSAFRTWATH